MQRNILVALISSILCLSGCGLSEEKAQTERYVDLRISELSSLIDKAGELRPHETAIAHRNVCDYRKALGDAAPLPSCNASGLSALTGDVDDNGAAAVKIALDRYADLQEREYLLTRSRSEAETTRQRLVAALITAHWDWAGPLSATQQNFDAAVAATAAHVSPKNGESVLLALSPPEDRRRFGEMLSAEKQLLEALADASLPSDLETAKHAALANIDALAEQLGAVEPANDRAAAKETRRLRKALRNKVGKEALARPQMIVEQTPDLAGLRQISGAPFKPGSVAQFAKAAGAFDRIRAFGAPDFSERPDPIDRAAAATLVEDCETLLALEEGAFDEACGAATDIISAALDLAESFNPGAGGQAPEDGSPSSDGAAGGSGGLDQLKTRIRAYVAARGIAQPSAPTAPVGLESDVRNTLIDGLDSRIKSASRAYAEAAVHGAIAPMAEATAKLELIHAELAKTVGRPLPQNLSRPFSLLEPSDAQSIMREFVRTDRVLSQALVLFPGEPGLEVTRQSLTEMKAALDATLANPAAKSDFAKLFKNIGEKQLDAILAGAEKNLAQAKTAALKSFERRFRALPANFDQWRGPRGPPQSKFPRSAKILTTFAELGRDPVEYIRNAAALQAEKAEFYQVLREARGGVPQAWRFGEARPLAWAMAQLDAADLARLELHFARTSAPTGPGASAVGWPEYQSTVDKILDAARQEVKLRKASSGHPPGYPPRGAPSLRAAADRYADKDAPRRPTALEQQYRFHIARAMYADSALAPETIRLEANAAMEGIIRNEVTRLETIVNRLSNVGERQGLLSLAALSVDEIPKEQRKALEGVKKQALVAADGLKKRIAAAEDASFIKPDPRRWKKLTAWAFNLNGGPQPPNSPAPSVDTKPNTPGSGGAGAAVAFRDLSLEKSFRNVEMSLADAEAKLRVAAKIENQETSALSVGTNKGRRVAMRNGWGASSFNFKTMVQRSGPRYPKGLEEWRGFFDIASDRPNRPFNFQTQIRQVTNFRGVGGGIHFGSVAAPDANTRALLGDGGLLFYEADEEMLELQLTSGDVYRYGPVAPRVLKSLFAFVSAYPGINLAVTIGATGEYYAQTENNESPVLLDPSFVDSPVGQKLYLADTIPWSLDAQPSENNRENPAAEAFALAKVAYEEASARRIEKIKHLIEGVQPLSETPVDEWKASIPESYEARAFVLAAVTSPDDDAFESNYRKERLAELTREVYSSPEFKSAVSSVDRNAKFLRDEGYSSEDLVAAIAQLKSSVLSSKLPKTIGGGKTAALVGILKNNGFSHDDTALLSITAIRLTELQSANPLTEYGLNSFQQFSNTAEYKPSAAVKLALIKLLAPQSKLNRALDEEISRLREFFANAENWAQRALIAARGLAEQSNTEIRVEKFALRIAASALLDATDESDLTGIATFLPEIFGSTNTLAVLLDDTAAFSLTEGVIETSVDMSYRYATTDYDVLGSALVFKLDQTDDQLPIRARKIEALAAAANQHLDGLMDSFSPLSDVRDYAALTAFLRWFVCPDVDKEACQVRDGFAVDFSALGAYSLRDRVSTPTPDAEVRD